MFKLLKFKEKKKKISERNFRVTQLLDYVVKTKLSMDTEFEAVVCDSYEEYDEFCSFNFDFISKPSKGCYGHSNWYYDRDKKVWIGNSYRRLFYVPIFKKITHYWQEI